MIGGFDDAARQPQIDAIDLIAKKRQEEHDKILAGKRIVGQLSSTQLWDLLPQEITDKYEVRYEIGRGTYGCVLLARPKDPKAFPRRVAIKLCRPEAGEMSLLLKEGLALRKVDSPWVARLIEMGAIAEKGGLVYFVMEHLRGSSLSDLVVERGSFRVKEACRVGLNLLDGLSQVHEEGLIHRDIKPHNIVRVEHSSGVGWEYKLVDFGTATFGGFGSERVGLPSFVLPGTEPSVPPSLRKTFSDLDLDGNGKLGTEEVVECLGRLGLRGRLASQQALALLQRYDDDDDGEIDLIEFATMYGELVALPYKALSMDEAHLRNLKEVFLSIADPGDDHIGVMQLQQCFVKLQRQPDFEQLQDLLARYDKDGNERIDFEEFCLMYGELVAWQDSLSWAGTHGYMSPEQYNKEDLTPASDVWGVGATLFKLVSGQLPFTVTGGTWGKGVIGDLRLEAPRLSSVVFGVPPAFCEVVAKALRKDVSGRYQTAAEMRAALLQVYESIPG